MTDGTVFTKQNLLGNDDYLFHESTTIPSGAMYMTYNAAMIDSLGLEAPESLAEKGEWTWDKFAEYAKACTQDTDGDGNMDVYGYGSAWTLTVQGFCASNNATTQKV
jgi:multiple sugar transport system substrate-binding protein